MNKNKVVSRQSNIELLRIIAMFFIIASHSKNLPSSFGCDVNYFSSFQYTFLRSLGQIGVIIFILISGYFLTSRKIKTVNFFKLALKTITYSILFYFVAYILDRYSGYCLGSTDGLKSFWDALFILSNSKYWFISVYLILYLLYPFINIITNRISKKQYLFILLTLFIIIFLYPNFYYTTLHQTEIIFNISYFIFIFLLGGYVARFPIDFKGKVAPLVGLFWSFFLFIISFLKTRPMYFRNSFSIFFISFFLFLLFKNIKINDSKIINSVAKSSFGIYLIHNHHDMKFYVWKFASDCFNFFEIDYFLKNILTILLIFATSLLLEYLLVFLGKPFIKKFEKLQIFQKMDHFFPQEELVAKEDSKYTLFWHFIFFNLIAYIFLFKYISYPTNYKALSLFIITLVLYLYCVYFINRIKRKNNGTNSDKNSSGDNIASSDTN